MLTVMLERLRTTNNSGQLKHPDRLDQRHQRSAASRVAARQKREARAFEGGASTQRLARPFDGANAVAKTMIAPLVTLENPAAQNLPSITGDKP